MKYNRLGNTGLHVSRICLGMMSYGTPVWRDWILTEEQGRPLLQRAVEAGVNFFDTANMYSNGVSEELTGKWLKEFFAGRDEYVLATKVFFPTGSNPTQRGLSRKHIFDAVDASLKRMGHEYIDLYQIHRWDYRTPIEETMEALHDVVKSGKVRYIGASSMWAWQFATAQHVAIQNGWTPFASMQNHYNLIYREEEREMNPFCEATGVGVIPWSPLARGFLAGNRARGGGGDTTRAKSDQMAHDYYYSESDFDIVDQLRSLATKHESSAASLALAWLLHKPAVTSPIVGVTKMPQLEDALSAIDISLDEAELSALEAPYQPKRPMGHE